MTHGTETSHFLAPNEELPTHQLDAPKRQKAAKQHQGRNRPFFYLMRLHQQLFCYEVQQSCSTKSKRSANHGVRRTSKQYIAQQ